MNIYIYIHQFSSVPLSAPRGGTGRVRGARRGALQPMRAAAKKQKRGSMQWTNHMKPRKFINSRTLKTLSLESSTEARLVHAISNPASQVG